MFLVLWEFEVKPGNEEMFESVYGPHGAWAGLFRRDPNYRETRLLRDCVRERCYVTLDAWETKKAYERFKAEQRQEYEALDLRCESLTLREQWLGEFED